MVRPLPPDYLQKGEPVLRKDRRHPRSLLAAWITGAILWIAALAGATVLGLLAPRDVWLMVGLPLTIAATVGYAVYLFASWRRVVTSLYILTEERIYRAYGKFRFHLLQTTYDKLTDLHVTQGPLGRRYGFGSVRLETAGAGLTLPGVRDPFGYKRQVEDARAAFLQTLVAEHRRRPKTASKVPPARGPAPALWEAQPTGASIVGRLLVAGWLVLFGVTGLATGFVGSRGGLLWGGGMLAVGALMVIAAVIHLRHTHYEVTGRGVSVTRGWLTRRRIETTFEKVTDVSTAQGLFGRMLNFGVIRINTAGSSAAAVVFEGLPDPEGVKAIIDEARAKVGGVGARHG